MPPNRPTRIWAAPFVTAGWFVLGSSIAVAGAEITLLVILLHIKGDSNTQEVTRVERARPDLKLESRETTVKYIWANIALNIQTRNETRNTKNMACDESHSLNNP